MQQILDLHIHSRYSRACSKDLTLQNIDKTCRAKGVDIVATGDFTHPIWFDSIKAELVEISNSGLYRHHSRLDDKIRFLLSTEVALIYKDGERARRIHLLIHAPNIAAAEELNKQLDKKYNIRSDGRPILGMSSPELIKLCMSIHPLFLIYPAHIWTPWFSVFGSKSGFDSLEECFKEQTENIYAFETGLSSDPEMNWRISALDKLTLLSNSDAHSLPNIGREANVFELKDTSYNAIYNVIKNKKVSDGNKEGVKFTIEFYPEEGMYHFDGHRSCNVSFSPAETAKHRGICPVCKKPLVIGVANRVEELADRPGDYQPKESPEFKKLIELDKIIAEAMGLKSRSSIKVRNEYDNLIKHFGNELRILLEEPLSNLRKLASPAIAEGISRVRTGKLVIKPGFDGQYGEIRIFSEEEKAKQQKMF